MMSGDRLGLKFPDICLMGEEKPQKNLTQETCPDRESNPGPLRERRIRYPLLHNSGYAISTVDINVLVIPIYIIVFNFTILQHMYIFLIPY